MLKWKVKKLTADGRLIEFESSWREPFKYEWYDSPEEAAKAIKAWIVSDDNRSTFWEHDFVIIGVCKT